MMNKQIVLICLCLSIFFQCPGKNIDSLKTELSRKGFDREVCIRIAQAYEDLNTDSALVYSQLLLKKISNTDYDYQARAANSIANCLFLNNYIDSSIVLYKKAISLTEKSGRKIHEGIYLSGLGQALMAQGSLKEAAEITEKAIEKLKQSPEAFQYEKQLANTYGILGDIYLTAGVYDLANKTYYETLKLSRNINDSVIMLSTLNSLGSSYNNMGDEAMAIEKYNKALLISKAVGHSIATGTIYLNLGEICLHQKLYTDAYNYLKKAEQGILESGTEFNLGNIYNYYGEFYKQTNDIPKAHEYYQKAIVLHQKANALLSRAQVQVNVADLLSIESQFNKAIKLFHEALDVFRKESSAKDIKDCVQKIKEHFIRTKNVDSISFYSKEFDIANQNFLDDEKQKAIVANEIKYQTSLKDETISQQLSEINFISKKNILYLSAGIIAIVMALALFFMYRKINLQKRNIEIQKQEILHNTKNNLSILMSIFGAQAEDEQTFAHAHENKDRILALNILNNLLYEKDGVSKANLAEYISKFCEAKSHSIGIPIIFTVSDKLLALKGNLLRDIGLLLNELMSNSAKYAFKQQINPEIHIVINSQLHSKLQIKYQDNGGGLPTNFDMNKERQSFGLDFVNDLIAQHKGSITHENEGGAKFNITLHFK